MAERVGALILSCPESIAIFGPSLKHINYTQTHTQTLCAMAERVGALILSCPESIAMFAANLSSGERGEPPQTLWDQVVAAMELTPEQVSRVV